MSPCPLEPPVKEGLGHSSCRRTKLIVINLPQEVMFQVIEEINIEGLNYTTQICREDDTDNITVPAGLKEVDLGVGAVPIKEEQSP